MPSTTVDLPNLAATEDLARRLGQVLLPGQVIGLIGPMGAGKTHFTRALAEGLGVDNPAAVNSPTFVLIQEYPGPIPLYHFDTYRLRDPREFLELGSEEYLFGEGVCVLEWADKVLHALPEDRLLLEWEVLSTEGRRLRVDARGPRSEAVFQKIFQKI